MHRVSPSALLLALFSLTSAASDLFVPTTSLPSGAAGAPYSASITASGGTQPYTWSNVFLGCPTPPCGLPPGLTATFNSSGVSISGVPTWAGNFFVIYRVADSSVPQQTASWSFTITIDPSNSLRIVTTSLPSGTAGVPYSAAIEAAGGWPPYIWSQEALPCAIVLLCEVPPGLQVTFSSTNVAMSGVPSQAGDFLVAYRVTDSSSPQQTAMRVFTISIAAPPAFFAGQNSLGSGAYYLQFPNGNLFGYYNLTNFPIFYHYDMGLEAFLDAGNGAAYLYDFSSGRWWYTSSSLFPDLYDFTLKAWIYYFPDTKNPGHYTANPRSFSNLTTGEIFTM